MLTRARITAVSMTAVVAILTLGACSQSGTVGTGGSDGAAKGSGGAVGGPTAPSSIGNDNVYEVLDSIDSKTNDNGCELATSGLRDLFVQVNAANPGMAKTAMPGIVGKFHDAAGQTPQQAVKAVVSLLAVDAQSWADGGLGDDTSLLNDVKSLATACTK